MSLIQAILAAAMGVFLHQFDPLITRLNTDSAVLKLLSRYAIGVLGTWPVFIYSMRRAGLKEKAVKEASNHFLFSFIFVGIGVFLARAMRSIT